LLFTDIEGSTRLLQRHPGRYADGVVDVAWVVVGAFAVLSPHRCRRRG
jgi:hypothetical protein